MANSYTTIMGDMADDIAYRVYGSEKYGVVIMTAAREMIKQKQYSRN